MEIRRTQIAPAGGGGGGEGGAVDSVNGQTGVVVLDKADVGLGNVNDTTDLGKPLSTATTTALAGKQNVDADLTAIAGLTHANDTIIQTAGGAWAARTPAQVKTTLALSKADVGLNLVDNTADTAKPVSSATLTALNAKAPLASPAFTGTPTGITKAHVGLGSVDNTADTAKPISTFTQAALNNKTALSVDGTFAATFDIDTTPITPGDIGAQPAGDYVTSSTITEMVTLTQAAYDLLTPDPDTFYVVVG